MDEAKKSFSQETRCLGTSLRWPVRQSSSRGSLMACPLRQLRYFGYVGRHTAIRLLHAGLVAMVMAWSASIASADEPIHLKIVGGIAGVSQYENFEKPFWDSHIEAMSNGRIQAEIHPFDRSGLQGQEMLQ